MVAYSVGGTPAQFQRNWRWCSKCQGLHFIENGLRPCKAGGNHIIDQSGDYRLSLGDMQAQGQIWRWCSKCAGLHFTGHDLRPCPAGGDHTEQGSGEYRLLQVGDYFTEPHQDNWRWCEKCGGLHFMGGSPPNNGVCPGGGGHSSEERELRLAILNQPVGFSRRLKPTQMQSTMKRCSVLPPGRLGNPAGRRLGSRNKTTLAAATLLAGEAEALTRKAVEMALQPRCSFAWNEYCRRAASAPSTSLPRRFQTPAREKPANRPPVT